MRRLLKEPLAHFLAAGLGLFLLFEIINTDGGTFNPRVIEVDRDTLLTFLQYRSRSFEPELAVNRLDSLPPAELEQLIVDYIREEVLHREALALGMDQNDYIIRRRLVQSIEYISTGFSSATVKLSDNDIEAYYAKNRDRYRIAPNVTYTHVFFGSEYHGREQALAMANEKLEQLNARQAGFNEASRHGDRFLYALNYVEREPGFVTSHFGPQMAQAIFDLETDESTWQGPLESPYGFHLVLLVRKTPQRYPELAEVLDKVRYDAERDAVDRQKENAIQAIVDTYEVRRNPITTAEVPDS